MTVPQDRSVQPPDVPEDDENTLPAAPTGAGTDHDAPDAPSGDEGLPPELGGQKGPEPTRYGDWEKGGRCTDF